MLGRMIRRGSSGYSSGYRYCHGWRFGFHRWLGGAPAAREEGRIAGLSAAAAAGHGDGGDVGKETAALRRHRRFQSRLWELHDLSPRPLSTLPAETLICRCEEVTLGDIQGNSYHVTEGLSAGETIVTSGILNLSDGAPITTEPPPPPPGGPPA